MFTVGKGRNGDLAYSADYPRLIIDKTNTPSINGGFERFRPVLASFPLARYGCASTGLATARPMPVGRSASGPSKIVFIGSFIKNDPLTSQATLPKVDWQTTALSPSSFYGLIAHRFFMDFWGFRDFGRGVGTFARPQTEVLLAL